MQLPTEMEHYKSDIEAHEYQIKRYQRFNLKPNRENMGSVSKSRESRALVVFLVGEAHVPPYSNPAITYFEHSLVSCFVEVWWLGGQSCPKVERWRAHFLYGERDARAPRDALLRLKLLVLLI